jgi:hypothetical protein
MPFVCWLRMIRSGALSTISRSRRRGSFHATGVLAGDTLAVLFLAPM